jgi:transcriptional regulator with XRE-family HTH domain
MNAKEFKRWRKAHGLSQTGAARKLGLKIRTIQYYEKGKRKDKPVDIPKAVALACFAISCGVDDVDYSQPEGRAIRPDRRDLLTPKE